jgi:hypothetical protein
MTGGQRDNPDPGHVPCLLVVAPAGSRGVPTEDPTLAPLAQSAEHIHGKDGVAGSIPAGGSTEALTSGNAGESPSGAVGADHIRIGMGCEGSARRQSAKRPAELQLWSGTISYGSNRAGRIAATEHITGPPASESCTRARGRQKGHADPGVASAGPLGWIKTVTVTDGSPGRFTDGRLWVRSVRGCMPSGEWSGRAGWCAFARLIRRRRRRRQSRAWPGDHAGRVLADSCSTWSGIDEAGQAA